MARPKAQDHAAKRAIILNKAAAVFADQGFDRASVANVAAACEISKANIYHYYASKDDILFDVLDGYLGGLMKRICGLDLSGFEPKDQFRKCVQEILLAYQGADNEHRLQSTGIAHLAPEQQGILLGHQRALIGHLASIVCPILPKEIQTDKARLRAVTMSIFGMLNWFYMWNQNADEIARRNYANLVCDLCLNGFSGLSNVPE